MAQAAGEAEGTERALALITRGAALREQGRAREAGASLREAIAIAERAGAGSIEERARHELSISSSPGTQQLP